MRCEDGSTLEINLAGLEFLPNAKVGIFKTLLAKNPKDRIELLESRSAFGADKPHVTKEKTAEFRHPVISKVRKTGEVEFMWSSKPITYFNRPKVVWCNTRLISTGTFIDPTGKYGLTQWCYGISAKEEDLESIAKCLESAEFKALMKHCIIDSFPCLNRKVLGLFRKDFWKEFV